MTEEPPGDFLPIVGDDCRSATGRCEFSTLPASQLSTAAIILAYVVTRITQAVVEGRTDANGVQLTIVSAITIAYIFLCLLLIEDIHIARLRDLRTVARWAEFGLRVVVLIAISIVPTFINSIPTLSGQATPANRIAIFLIILYVFFLSWDAVVYFGAPDASSLGPEIRNIALRFLFTDSVGILLLVAAAACYDGNQSSLAALVLFVLIVFTGVFQLGRVLKDLSSSGRFTGVPLIDIFR